MGKKNASEVPAYNEMMCELFQALKELGGSCRRLCMETAVKQRLSIVWRGPEAI